MTKRKKKLRGFVLLVVLLVALAAAIIASAMVATSMSARLDAAHSAGAEAAAAIARSGMERASTYLQTVGVADGDLDQALDPDLSADCSSLPSTPAPCANCNMPELTDPGAAAVTYNGKNYLLVPYGAGAYMIRFDDDSDDQRTEPNWAATTSNHPGSFGTCVEGPTDIGGGGDNPLRDRDRMVLITVVGISPGTNPDSPNVHRVTLHQAFQYLTAPSAPGITVGHDFTSDGADFNGCSPEGSVAVGHNIKSASGGSGCTCGDSFQNGGTVPSQWQSCIDESTSGCNAAQDCALGSITTALPSPSPVLAVPDPFSSGTDSDKVADWTSPCNFMVINGGANQFALFVWDPGASRGGGAPCSNMAGSSTPVPAPKLDDPGFGACWTPLVISDGGGGICAPFPTNVNGATGAFEPKNDTPAPVDGASLNSMISTTCPGATFGTANATDSFNKPDFSLCAIAPAGAYPGQTAVTGNCTAATCNGSNAVLESDGTQYWFAGGLNPAAVPAADYFFAGVNINTSVSFGGTAPSGATLTLGTNWPPATVIVQGDLTISGAEWFGTGHTNDTSMLFPSLIVTHDAHLNAGVTAMAGTVWVGNNLTWNSPGTIDFYGEIHAGHDLKVQSGTFNWHYPSSFGASLGAPTAGTPLTFLSTD